jgi:hypothetical protein
MREVVSRSPDHRAGLFGSAADGGKPSCRRRLRKCSRPREAAGPQTADGTQEAPSEMLTPTQQRAVDRFAKSLSTLGDDALIDSYHQAWEDHRDARAEGSDNLGKAGAESLAAKTAMQQRFADYQSRYKERYP